jgi:hypothetical protein
MKRVLLAAILLVPQAGILPAATEPRAATPAPRAAEATPPAPAGCHWQSLPEIKASLAVPDGWQFAAVSSDQVLSYEVRPAGPGFEQTRSVYRLEVRLATPVASVRARAKEFVENVRKGALEAQPVDEQQVGVMTGFSSFARYAPRPGSAAPASVLAASIANTRTGTLYKIRFEIPVEELERVGPLGSALFQAYRLDDEV